MSDTLDKIQDLIENRTNDNKKESSKTRLGTNAPKTLEDYAETALQSQITLTRISVNSEFISFLISTLTDLNKSSVQLFVSVSKDKITVFENLLKDLKLFQTLSDFNVHIENINNVFQQNYRKNQTRVIQSQIDLYKKNIEDIEFLKDIK